MLEYHLVIESIVSESFVLLAFFAYSNVYSTSNAQTSVCSTVLSEAILTPLFHAKSVNTGDNMEAI